ncbi:MAG: hypothetical protein E7269_02275 [Lachnospiraceae bacterium]|nr:hypothetical protein [Lachnospiraceae bacterium]
MKILTEYILQSIKAVFRSRLFLLAMIIFALYGCIIVRLFDLQIVNSDQYMNTYLEQTEREIVSAGTRGLIYDRKGNLLAGNELSYAVTITDDIESSKTKNETLNSIIHHLVSILHSNGDELTVSTSIDYTDNSFVYTTSSESARIRFLKDIYGVSDLIKEDGTDLSLSTAEDAYLFLKDKYGVDEDYTIEEALDIITVRFELSAIFYQKYKSVTVATDISDESVAAIYEQEAKLTGVAVELKTTRVYYDSKYFAHIIGYTGSISETQLETFLEEGKDYISSDVVGKSGIESYMEDELQGTKGYKTVSVNSTGKVLDVLSVTEAEAGNDVYLTIDRDLQIAAYNLLEQELAGILISKIKNIEPSAQQEGDTDIPVKQVYFQLINNNIVDITILNREDATANEQTIYSIYQQYEAEAVEFLTLAFQKSNTAKLGSYSSEKQKYITSCIDMLENTWSILDTSTILSADTTKTAWNNGELAPAEWLTYCIAQNCISLSRLGINDEYASSDVIFDTIVAYIFEHIEDNTAFAKIIYQQLIYASRITGGQVCNLLYNQGVLKEDQTMMSRLATGRGDISYQFILDKISSLEITPGELALDPCSGSVVITDPNNGDVLACVTYPSYDNNYLSGSIDATYWNKLLADAASPLYNRATQTRTAPGSTFKMLTAITGLEEGIITSDTVIVDKGIFTAVTPSPRCWIHPGNHGAINCKNALKVSCNYFFYQIGYTLGKSVGTKYSDEAGLDILEKYADMFGLTSKSGIEIDENEPLFSTENIVRSAIGQGSHSYSNVQLARYVSTIANGGNNYELTLIDKVQDSAAEEVSEMESMLTNIVTLQDSTWDTVTTGMRLVIRDGSIKSVFAPLEKAGVYAAGKSGTAQENLLRSNHSLFVSMAPYDDPEVVTTVVIPFGGTSSYAAEVNSKILQYYYGLITLDEIMEGSFTGITSEVTND